MTYYSNLFGCEPVLMVTDVFNAAQYARIEPETDLMETVTNYVASCHLDSEEEETAEMENIMFYSMMLKNW